MIDRENDEILHAREEMVDLLNFIERCTHDLLALNSALMILITNHRFRDVNLELLIAISEQLQTARERTKVCFRAMQNL